MSVGAVSIRDVAELAGVSVGTVSNVLNRPDLVTPSTRTRVQAAIAELGFVRNESARQLRAGQSRTLGLVVLDVANPFFTDVARGVEDTASAAGLAVILCNSDEKSSKEHAYLDLLEEQRVKGILITPADGISELVDIDPDGRLMRYLVPAPDGRLALLAEFTVDIAAGAALRARVETLMASFRWAG